MEETNHINFISLLIPVAFIIFVISIGVILLNQHFQKNLYRQKLEKETLKTKNQQDLLQSVIQTQEEERKRIARDMHDELGALLSMARMHVLQAEQSCKDSSSTSFLKNAREMTEAALENMRRISHELMPPTLENFGLLQTLESFSKHFQGENMKIEINAPQDMPRFPVTIEINLYRVLMEMISNTIKHAGATDIVIQFVLEADQLAIEYQDNGGGFPDHTSKGHAGAGLKNMEARINALRGNLNLGNGPFGGMHALIQIPLTKV
jgi:signal transduction histidine kinase